MQPIAEALSDEEVAAVARAYAGMPKVNVKAEPIERPEPGTGAWLALRGAWERNIPECVLCHGPNGVGVGSVFPPLAGQSALYIENQLKRLARHASHTGHAQDQSRARSAPHARERSQWPDGSHCSKPDTCRSQSRRGIFRRTR